VSAIVSRSAAAKIFQQFIRWEPAQRTAIAAVWPNERTGAERCGRVRLCWGSHSGLSSLSISALASAVAFSMACSRVRELALSRRETRLSQ
jgi:hypothetical protein